MSIQYGPTLQYVQQYGVILVEARFFFFFFFRGGFLGAQSSGRSRHSTAISETCERTRGCLFVRFAGHTNELEMHLFFFAGKEGFGRQEKSGCCAAQMWVLRYL